MTNLTIGKKLLAAFSVMLALILGLLTLYVLQARRSNDQLELVLHKFSHKLEIGSSIELTTTEMQGAQRGLMLSYIAKDSASAPQYVELYRTSGAKIDDLLRELEPLATSATEQSALSTIKESRATWGPRFDQLVSMCEAGQIDEAYKLRSQNKLVSAAMHTAATSLVSEQKTALSAAELESRNSVTRTNWMTGIFLVIALVVGVVVLILVGQITSSLRRTVEEIASGAGQIADGAQQISASSQSLAEGTSQQAASITEASAATEEISSMTQRNADGAIKASNLMQSATTIVDEANRSLELMQLAMNEINGSSDKVSKIIKTIDQIAFQTNILALNAAVEAARAGQAGLGFAVVADEVRSLAQRSAQAAKDTAILIEESITKSKEGLSSLELVTMSIGAITQNSTQVKHLVEEVKSGSAEQSRGIRLIAKQMTEMERVTQGAAARAEEGAATGEQMQAYADSLNGIVQSLHAMVG